MIDVAGESSAAAFLIKLGLVPLAGACGGGLVALAIALWRALAAEEHREVPHGD